MLNNDILRRLRYALSMNDEAMLELFRLGNLVLDAEKLQNYLKREEEAGYQALNDRSMTAFLDGLILKKRGPRKEESDAAPRAEVFNNNLILRKLKIAQELKEEDMLLALERGGRTTSRAELSAFFRQQGHKNYQECKDQILRTFLAGLPGFKRTK